MNGVTSKAFTRKQKRELEGLCTALLSKIATPSSDAAITLSSELEQMINSLPTKWPLVTGNAQLALATLKGNKLELAFRCLISLCVLLSGVYEDGERWRDIKELVPRQAGAVEDAWLVALIISQMMSAVDVRRPKRAPGSGKKRYEQKRRSLVGIPEGSLAYFFGERYKQQLPTEGSSLGELLGGKDPFNAPAPARRYTPLDPLLKGKTVRMSEGESSLVRLFMLGRQTVGRAVRASGPRLAPVAGKDRRTVVYTYKDFLVIAKRLLEQDRWLRDGEERSRVLRNITSRAEDIAERPVRTAFLRTFGPFLTK